MRTLLKIILTALILYLLTVLIFNLFQEKIIFQNVKLDSNYSFSFEQNFEEITLNTKNNSQINALLFKAENPKGVLLYFHGNKGNLVRWGKIASYFTKYNMDVFVIDYRSYGKSKGKFDEKSMYKDAQASYNYLKSRYSENKISIYGRSLGTTFAVRTAALNNPKQLILESPFYNLNDVAKYHYPFLPFKLLLKYKFNTNAYISSVPCKTTIFHGDKDKVVPLSSCKKLYERSNLSQTSFFIIKGGTHHNLFDFSIYQDEISALFKN